MDILGGVLKLVTSKVSDLIGGLTNQQNMIQELVQSPLQSMISEVSGGIWTGDGANAFMDEVNGTFLPTSQNVHDSIGGIRDSISTAQETIEAADSKAAGLVNDLADIFGNIYK
jgi:uncharacterized protein YukE